jgi:hypothetical protein
MDLSLQLFRFNGIADASNSNEWLDVIVRFKLTSILEVILLAHEKIVVLLSFLF